MQLMRRVVRLRQGLRTYDTQLNGYIAILNYYCTMGSFAVLQR